MKYIPRHAEKALLRLASSFPAVLLTGARQVGKTTLLTHLARSKPLASVSFDNPLEELSAKTDPRTYLDRHPSPYLFDEIQYVPELFRWMKLKIDAQREPAAYWLTGSDQPLLMKNVTESLAGRVGLLDLYGFSARELRFETFDAPFVPSEEFLEKRSSTLQGVEDTAAIWERIYRGAFPDVATGRIASEDFFGSYLRTYIERDIHRTQNTMDTLQFLQFVTAAASRTAQLVNLRDMASSCAIPEAKAKQWLSLLVSSGLVYLLPPYASNVEKRVVKTPKLYFMDTGLAAYLTRWPTPETLSEGAMAGAFFETYVVSEIVKSFANQAQRPPLYFYRDKDQIEIDLIIERAGMLFPVEVKKTACPNGRDARNFSCLERIKTPLGTPCIVCSVQSEGSVKRGEKLVRTIPLSWL